ncbi:MAG: TonB-dependent siderophore receptor [Novosphingobium sp.]
MAEEADSAAGQRPEIVVTGLLQASAGTKTDTPLVETPQPITVITDDIYLAQGAISISDTLRYVAGVQANPYGPDGRVDGGFIRGINALQFRDGMRDLYSYYASIRSDPYNFSQVEVVRGPASVLFGNGSIGGLINLVSKTPQFEPEGEVSLRAGSHSRLELLADVTGPVSDDLAARLAVRVRDSGTQTNFVPDDRVLVAPSVTWSPGSDTSVTLIGMYQEDDGGSTSQFLPLFGTIYPNPNGRLPHSTFIGKPGWDRYDGRLLEGTGIVEHRFSDMVRVSLKARYIDSDLTYLTHYPNNYSTPTNPFLDADQRIIGLYADGSYAGMNVFSTDNNLRFDFGTGENIDHTLLAGIDYSWNRVTKTGGFGFEQIDIYDIDYDSLLDYGGGLPDTFGISTTIVSQKQLGFYLQDQIRLWDRVSIVLGGRRDHVRTQTHGSPAEKANATTFRAGIIGEVTKGVSPFFSFTESFEPISGTDSAGRAYIPKTGRQFEAGIKFHPDEATLVTFTAYHIKESNRPISDDTTPDPFDQIQAGELVSKGFELEARRVLPGDFEILANYSYNKAELTKSDDPLTIGKQLGNVPKHNASIWATKTLEVGPDTSLRLGGGVRYSSANYSFSSNFPDGIRTPHYTLVDALAELSWHQWLFSINATNLFDKTFYSACLARGDCFNGELRNVFGTVTYRF